MSRRPTRQALRSARGCSNINLLSTQAGMRRDI
jgi:hypothetical protein